MSDSSEEVQESADRVFRDSFAALRITSANDVDVLQQENLQRAREEIAYSLHVDVVERLNGVLVRLSLLLLLPSSSSSSSSSSFFFV